MATTEPTWERVTVAKLREALAEIDGDTYVKVEGHGSTLRDWSGNLYMAEVDGLSHVCIESL